LFIALVLQRLKQPKQPSHSPATNNLRFFSLLVEKKNSMKKYFFVENLSVKQTRDWIVGKKISQHIS